MSQVKKNGVMKESWWVMSQIQKKMVSWMSHNESCHKSKKKKWCHEWVMMSHVTSQKQKWVMSQIISWMSHVAPVNESCCTCEWVTLHLWRSDVSRVNASCHTYECVMSHIRMSLVTHTNGSRSTYSRVTSQVQRCGNSPQWMLQCATVCCSKGTRWDTVR